MQANPQISIVVPLFNEEESLPELTQWIDQVMKENSFTYEVLLIDDGSKDRSWEVVQELKKSNPNIKGFSFLRNYGKSAALQVGFQHAQGKVVITMDADLQDSPDEIPGLYKMIVEDGYDLVSGWKRRRHDPISKTIPSKFFNGVTRWMSGIKLHDFNCGLKAYNQRVVKVVQVYGEMHRYIPVMAKWEGFTKIGEKVVEHRARKFGYSKFGLERFINGFLDLLSITFVTRFKKRPMHFFGTFGMLSFLVGLGSAATLVIEKVWRSYQLLPIEREVTDQPLFYLALTAIIIGVQLFLAGFLAEMVSLNEPNRNEYHIKDTV